MRKRALPVAVIAVAVIAVAFTIKGSGRVKAAPDHLVFERDVEENQGAALDPSDIVSAENNQVRLSDVFSADRVMKYGGYNTAGTPSGGELRVTFRWKSGDAVTRTEVFHLPEDTSEADNEARNRLVNDKRKEFDQVVATFVAPVPIRRTYGIALDTTEGVNADLSRRVKQVITETGAIKLGADSKNSVTLNLYMVTENPYQGGRQRPTLMNAVEVESATEWLLMERPARKNSSVLGGLKAVIEEMAQGDNPILHVFTDGLENTDTVSVYQKPELLDEANWPKLDQAADLASLNLASLTIHLHPLPAKSAAHAKMMEKGLDYLADRLTKAGAKVKIEPF